MEVTGAGPQVVGGRCGVIGVSAAAAPAVLHVGSRRIQPRTNAETVLREVLRYWSAVRRSGLVAEYGASE